MKTISILNLKGGVAKTFTAANMAYELYRRGYKVLLIDNDKQGNLSKAYSRYDAENVAPVTRLLAGDWENADELIQHTEYEGIDIVTANMSLFGATWNLTKEDSENQIERYKALVYAKMQYYGDCTIYGKYDYKHRATHRKVRKDSIKRIKRTIKKCESGKITKEQLQKSIQSWTGHAGHADSYNLRKKIETLAEAAIEKAA